MDCCGVSEMDFVLGMVEVFVSLGLDGMDDWIGERRTGLYTLIETSSSFED